MRSALLTMQRLPHTSRALRRTHAAQHGQAFAQHGRPTRGLLVHATVHAVCLTAAPAAPRPWPHPTCIWRLAPHHAAGQHSGQARNACLCSASQASGHSRVSEYLSALNDEQQDAVYCPASAVRVKAGPGSGKTRVVTARVARLLQDGVDPASILVITFTNKAADELKERINGVLGSQPGANVVAAGTFHSICCRILRAYVEDLPQLPVPRGESPLEAWDRNFAVFDTDDALRAMKYALLTVLNIDSCNRQQNILAKNLCDVYSSTRNEVATVHYNKILKQVYDHQAYQQLLVPLREGDVLRCFAEYTRVCCENNAIDFDDLLGLTVALLQHVPAARQELQSRWKHILVDEFQDTNSAQYEIVRLLRGPGASGATTFVVGDSDQAIYSWRGAKPENMDQQFAKDFPNCETLFLSRNYRSGYDIVEAAEAVLSYGGLPAMHQRTVPMKKMPGRVELARPYSERVESLLVTDKIKQQHAAGIEYKDIAVLYRTRSQSRLFEEQLAVAGIPFRVLGDKPFWTRSEVKHMTSYLRLVANPAQDSMALEQIINIPARKLGNKTVDQLSDLAKKLGVGLAALLLGDLRDTAPLTSEQLTPLLLDLQREGKVPAPVLNLVPDIGTNVLNKVHGLKLTKPARQGLQHLRATIHLARSIAFHKPVDTTLWVLQLASGYEDYIAGEPEKMESLRILDKAAKASDTWLIREEDLRRHTEENVANNPLEQLQLFLQHIALMRELDEVKDKDQEGNQVTLMTVHAAKGLEFHTVFFVGFYDGRVPLLRQEHEMLPPDERHKSILEEKRLAYVGCTRAMEYLFIVWPQAHVRYSEQGPISQPTTESRFLEQVAIVDVGNRIHSSSYKMVLQPPSLAYRK